MIFFARCSLKATCKIEFRSCSTTYLVEGDEDVEIGRIVGVVVGMVVGEAEKELWVRQPEHADA